MGHRRKELAKRKNLALPAGPVFAPSFEDIEALSYDTIDRLPDDLLDQMPNDVVFVIQDFADDSTLQEMEIEDPFELLGHYSPVPVGSKHFGFTTQTDDQIFLYRRPILDFWCESGEELAQIVRQVVITEIGNHIGLNEEEIDRYCDEASEQ